jgi:hypothetical protein
MHGFDGVIRGGRALRPNRSCGKGAGPGDELDALRNIFLVNERAQFEFAVTEASLREVVERDEQGCTQWVHDVLNTWLIQSASEEPVWTSTLDDRRFGNIRVKDAASFRTLSTLAATPS